MSSSPEHKTDARVEEGITHIDHASHDGGEKITAERAGAIEAENAEANMGVLEAVRAYPLATFWAFVMSFTIVSCQLVPHPHSCSFETSTFFLHFFILSW
jgi:SP family general alpha glucoside:H+ symporter-like MFS transporter